MERGKTRLPKQIRCDTIGKQFSDVGEEKPVFAPDKFILPDEFFGSSFAIQGKFFSKNIVDMFQIATPRSTQ
jgi:hypothetical protein